MSQLELYRNLLIKKKKRGLKDLFYFNKYVIESEEKRRRYLVDHVHGEWARWYENSTSRIKMILVPRGCFKSSFFTVGRTLQALSANRNERILIANATLDNSQRFLGEIKDHLRKNPQLLELYGDPPFFSKVSKWNEGELEVTGRNLGRREASVTAIGVGGNLVSQHYSKIIIDDLVNLENSATRYQANKVIDWWKRAFSLLDYDGEMLIIGTRWSYYELYSWILKKFGEQVDVYIKGAYKEDGSLYFPELLDAAKLKELRGLQGSYVFSSFYLNNPVDEESALIKKSQIKYWETLPKRLNIFAMCDPAVSQSIGADESSITIAGVDWENNWYVLEVRHGIWTVGQLIENLFAVFKDWSPLTMTIEVIGQGQMLLEAVYNEENTRNIYLPLVEIKSRPRITKEMRIRAVLQPRFERGKIYIKEGMFDLEEQLLRFPRSQRDDIIDSLADLEEITFAPERAAAPTETTSNYFEELLKKHARGDTGSKDEIMGEFY